MRVLHLTDLYAPVIGGLERHVETLSKALAQRGHSVAVATLDGERAPRFENADGVRIHRLRSISQRLPVHTEARQPFHPTFPDPGVMAGLRRVLAEERPDVVHAHSWIVYSFIPLRAWSKARLVVTLHSFSLVCAKQVYVHKGRPCSGPAYLKCIDCAADQYGRLKSLAVTTGLRLSRPLHEHVDRYLAVSSAVARVAAAKGARTREAVEVVPGFNPDDVLGEIASVERPSFLPKKDGYLLFVGALGPHKGLDVLLQAYAGLVDPVPLVVIGTRRHDTPHDVPAGVTVFRDVPHAQVMRAWAHCGVAVVPSVCQESFGMVAIEAMACGRPVVASDIGGLSDIVVDGKTGLLVPPGEVGMLRHALRTLLADSSLRARMGEAARARARLYTASAVVTRIEDVYMELVGDDRPRSRDGVPECILTRGP
jgi:glycosyltransferase involved in cell wall biosynthesis